MTAEQLAEIIAEKPLHHTQTVVRRLRTELKEGQTLQQLAEPANYRIIFKNRLPVFLSSWREVDANDVIASVAKPPEIKPPESKAKPKAKSKGRMTKKRKDDLLKAIQDGEKVDYAELLAVAKSLKIEGANQKPKPELIELVTKALTGE